MDGVAVAVASESDPATCAHLQDPNPMLRILDAVVHWCLRAFRYLVFARLATFNPSVSRSCGDLF